MSGTKFTFQTEMKEFFLRMSASSLTMNVTRLTTSFDCTMTAETGTKWEGRRGDSNRSSTIDEKNTLVVGGDRR